MGVGERERERKRVVKSKKQPGAQSDEFTHSVFNIGLNCSLFQVFGKILGPTANSDKFQRHCEIIIKRKPLVENE